MKVLILMGVSGCGKTTVGRLLADQTGGTFHDGDDFHPPENIRKMSSGIPLTDEDREVWLEALAKLIRDAGSLTIIACSALKGSYRQLLQGGEFVFLDGPPQLLASRLAARRNHYMPPGLLASQLETLEPPEQALTLDIRDSPAELVRQIRNHYGI
jgi:gluconokinase